MKHWLAELDPFFLAAAICILAVLASTHHFSPVALLEHPPLDGPVE